MAYFSEARRGEAGELKQQLSDPRIDADPAAKREVIKKVIMNMTAGIDMSSLFGDMIKATHTNDLAQKKLVYLYLSHYSESNPETALLIVNHLQTDARDRMQDPSVRGLALRTLASLRVPNLVEYVIPPLKGAMVDPSPYVRKTAVMGVVKMYQLAPDLVREEGFVKSLYGMLRDKDPLVITNTIYAIDEVDAHRGGVVVDAPLVTHLLNRIRDFNEWGQCMILDKAAMYTPKEDEERIGILNILDDRLSHINSAVVFAAVRVFLRLTADIPSLARDVLFRIKAPLLTQMSGGSVETLYVVMCHLRLLLHRQPRLLDADYTHFFIRYSDPPFIKSAKLSLLEDIGCDENGVNIISEVSEYVMDVDRQTATQAIATIGRIAANHAGCARAAVEALLSFLKLDNETITSTTVMTMKDLLRKYPDVAPLLLPSAHRFLAEVDGAEAKCVLIWMLGEYGESVEEAPYLLESMVEQYEDSEVVVRLQLLTSVMKMFFKRPPECQAMLGALLDMATNDVDYVDVHDRAVLYYRLLQHDVREAAQVVNSPATVVTEFYENVKADTKEAVFQEFNTMAVLFNKPSSLFTVRRAPYTKGLQRDLYDDDDDEDAGDLPAPLPPKHAVVPVEEPPRPAAQTHTRANLLDDLSFSMEPRPAIVLNAGAVLSPQVFQEQWALLPVAGTVETPLPSVPQPARIAERLRKAHIKVVAQGTVNDVAKFYFFAVEEGASDDVFLVELVTSLLESTSFSTSATFKTASPNSAVFISHFKGLLLAPDLGG